MSISTRIVINAVMNWLATLIRAAIGVALVPFLIIKLGTTGYGFVALLEVTVSLTWLFDLGLRNALGRQLAEQVARGDVERFNDLASSAFALYLAVGILFGAVCFLGAPWLAMVFNVPDPVMPQAVFALRWYASISILFSFLRPVFAASLTSNHRFDLVHAVNMGMSILEGLSLLAVLGLTAAGIYGWIAVFWGSDALRFMATLLLAYRVRPNLKIGLGRLRRDSLRSLLSLGRWMYALQLTQLLRERADPIVITGFYGPSGVAIYAPASSVHGVVSPLVSVLTSQLFPVATHAHVKGRVRDLQAVLIRGTRYTLLMGIPFCVLLALFAPPIMQFWLEDSLGPNYRTTAWVLVGWAIIELIEYAGGSQYPVLLGMNRLRFLVLSDLPAAICKVLLSIWLVGHTQLGIVGAVVATIAIDVVRRPLITAYTARCCALPLQRYFLQAYLRPLIVLAAVTAIGLAMRHALLFEGLGMLAVAILTVGVSWAALCWWVGFVEQDRCAFLQLVDGLLDRMFPARGPKAAVAPRLDSERPIVKED